MDTSLPPPTKFLGAANFITSIFGELYPPLETIPEFVIDILEFNPVKLVVPFPPEPELDT